MMAISRSLYQASPCPPVVNGEAAIPSEAKVLAAEERVREAEAREGEAQEKWQAALRSKEEAESRQQEAETKEQAERARRQEVELREQAERARRQEMEDREEATRARLQEVERDLEAVRLEARRLEALTRERPQRRSTDTEESLRQYQVRLQELETQWEVEREELQMTGPELGRGAWATVSVAKFRGVRVAAKVIHGQILSRHNLQLFRREMNMAARIRHPNLLQFIGATKRGEMVILTELMPTSLRKELQRECDLSPEVVAAIGLDVVRAINYLHLMRPRPMIHRDISSANVLLEPLPDGYWRAKVSDYGTVNLQQQLSTVGPGSPCYAAPEANDPTQQSTKMDIFSFGALLIEMLAGELPVPDERPRLLLRIDHQPLLALIHSCMSSNKEDRPTASEIISKLELAPLSTSP